MNSPRVSLAALLGAQAQFTFNDNAAKLMLIALAQFPGVLAGIDDTLIRAVSGAVVAAPFVAFSPLAGWLNDRFAKSRVLNVALAVQFFAMLALIAALWLRSLWGSIACFTVLALQACVFAPAKRAILRELVGLEQLSRAVSRMEMLSIGAILAGAFGGGWMFDRWTHRLGDPWQGAMVTAAALAVLSALSWGVFQFVSATTAQSTEPFSKSLFFRHGTQIAELWRARPLFRAVGGLMLFWGLGGYVYLLFLQMGSDRHQGGVGSATLAGVMLLLLGVGTIVGNHAAGRLSRRGVELGLAPLGGGILTVALVASAIVGHAGPAFYFWLVVAGFGSGLFLVPLYAFIQETAGAHRRGRVLAAAGLLDSTAGFAANGLFYILASDHTLDLSPAGQLFVLAAITLAMVVFALRHLPHQAVCTAMRLLGALLYRVRVRGAEHVPPGGALVICNHLSYVDAIVLQVAAPRNVRFVAFAGSTRSVVLRYLYRALGVIPVALNKPTKGIRLAEEALGRGEVVCVFPEGDISRTGQLMRLQPGYCRIAEAAKVPVVPAVIDGLWGSVFSFAGNKYLWKSPRLMPTDVFVLFGPPIPHDRITPAGARQILLDLGAEAFEERPALRRNLAREAVRALAKRPGHVEIIDRTAERRVLKAGQLLAVAAALSRHIRRTIPEGRVGIVLPPGIGGTLVNLAVLCAGKTPVNLNFTSSRAALEASFRLGEIRTIITADAMRARLPNFPWPERTLDLQSEIQALGGKRAIVPWLLAAWLLPNQWMADLLRIPRTGDRAEAALLFTSGSSGEPKGVVLSHRNILANCAQVSSLSILPSTATLVGCLPIFHSMGFTITVWYPILRGCRVVTVPSPLDTRKIVEAIAGDKATVMVGAPTFIRPFLKKATKEDLKSLNLVVTGAEKLPMDLYNAFQTTFGIEIMQGYGLTETTPVSNVNQPDPPVTLSSDEPQPGKRTGSVGRLMPGMTARIADPDTGALLPADQQGIVLFKGANVFYGYLKDPGKTAEAMRDGWFVTGDLGRFDEDGFLYIEGRLSRFSKIGGEMVPHGTVEQAVATAFGWEAVDGPTCVVVGLPDAIKGEAIVLLTIHPVGVEEVRARLLATGLPNLWIPKIVHHVESIPLLGSGKTDIKGCRTLALELARDVRGG